MSLTIPQLTTLKADILADPILNANPNNPDGNQVIADAYNALAVPDYFVWRTSLTEKTVTTTKSNDGVTEREFSWSGAGGYISRSQGERDAWARLLLDGAVNPTLANNRQAFADIFSGGTGEAANNRAHLLAHAVRGATRAQKLFSIPATGPGNNGALPRGDRGNPDAMTVEASITRSDVESARNL